MRGGAQTNDSDGARKVDGSVMAERLHCQEHYLLRSRILNLGSATKPLRKIDWIADAHILGIYLIRPNFEPRQKRLSIHRSNGAIHRIVARANADATNPRLVEARVEHLPPTPEIHLKVGVKIIRGSWILIGDVRHVAAHVAGWKIECSAEGDGRVSEIATHPIAALYDVMRGEVRAA